MEYIAFIYFTFGFLVAFILFVAGWDANDMSDRKPFHKFLVYFIGATIIFFTWPVWVIIIIRIYYKINKGEYNG